MHTTNIKLDKSLEYDIFRANLNRRKRDPIQAVKDALELDGIDSSEFTTKELKSLYEEGYIYNVEL